MRTRCLVLSVLLISVWVPFASAQLPRVIPHAQDHLPNEAMSPEDAVKRMTVPEGFRVEIVASEPEIVNPVAMTFDERGRIWITESLEYPRRRAGVGRDRIKILEDTDGDGKADKFTIFAEGLNIPSGIAVGHGGVWVANSPDLLFLQDTDGDGKADKREVIVSGFGRSDTHELPNSLSWGPDGWLYGWNGVFNPSSIAYRGKTYDFTCAIFRIHPKTRDFELYCEGTSNPWGLAWDREGSAFASACVIDHLWHLTETGYYHRQGGPYPPFTWKIESIVDHEHQKAAYCGLHFYDSDTYPEKYRERLFMGNIHGDCVNVDQLQRKGSTYVALKEPDFLSANDAWFMPVSQKTGPDGSLYILDWYDQYHCYQDANRDPGGIDRLKGRLYRVRYQETPRRTGFDLSKKTDDELVALLGSGNGYDRETAQRLLAERETLPINAKLQANALDASLPRRTRMHSLWALISRAAPDPDFLLALLSDNDSGFRAWGVRAAGNARKVDRRVLEKIVAMARDSSPDVQLQVAIASRKVEGIDAIPLLLEVASNCRDDSLIPKIVWQNLQPLIGDSAEKFSAALDTIGQTPGPGFQAILPRALERLVSGKVPNAKAVVSLLKRLILARQWDSTKQAIDAISSRIRERSLDRVDSLAIRDEVQGLLTRPETSEVPREISDDLQILLAYWGVAPSIELAKLRFESKSTPESSRLRALDALIFAAEIRPVLNQVRAALTGSHRGGSVEFRGKVLSALGALESPDVAPIVLEMYPGLEPELKPRAVELLSQRPAWSLALLDAIGAGKVAASAVNLNQARKLQASRDPKVVAAAKLRLGIVREGRNPQREQVIRQMKQFLDANPGDPFAGKAVFTRVCAQCHKIYGEGQDVGPEISQNGRASFDQLLSNVFDPSLVIGLSYQGTTVATSDGRVLTGLVVEDNAQRIVLKLQGGKVESLARAQVEEVKVSSLSLMPEDLEKQLKPQELADLFAFITLDRPPTDNASKPIPGAEGLGKGRK